MNSEGKPMSRINEVVKALSQSRRMYQRIMKRKRYTHFYTNELYSPSCADFAA